ncbi:uncharacterized protein L969DRAFT_89164 [Mixia osmundae IAM 14324]|uniref:Uncharacterized protein n=1 Tax=Mixia osmundae (strain CBS 9802 / IAM 14324 / JCM 22182 / KY 12970) TaxID=764103 RepID=G7DSL4_MIXOS|nr:uncharacterized protein L969DRAFT_89164 [Mixia osmundae IAM 14324]KEI37930.1 hypothetical protein L969DRAFT_89164 [Mixia osmundae IAM 14324]GAA93574.1 hypothetical protein E5Q_00218 [Mixia osmundae IAM 14324]
MEGDGRPAGRGREGVQPPSPEKVAVAAAFAKKVTIVTCCLTLGLGLSNRYRYRVMRNVTRGVGFTPERADLFTPLLQMDLLRKGHVTSSELQGAWKEFMSKASSLPEKEQQKLYEAGQAMLKDVMRTRSSQTGERRAFVRGLVYGSLASLIYVQLASSGFKRRIEAVDASAPRRERYIPPDQRAGRSTEEIELQDAEDTRLAAYFERDTNATEQSGGQENVPVQAMSDSARSKWEELRKGKDAQQSTWAKIRDEAGRKRQEQMTASPSSSARGLTSDESSRDRNDRLQFNEDQDDAAREARKEAERQRFAKLMEAERKGGEAADRIQIS